jgi:hypothetical protein
VHDARFPKNFRPRGNIVKYNSKTNPIVWLEDYHLTCKAGGADNDLFIIQFLLISLANSAKTWLDNLSRNINNSWEDL